MEKIATDEIQKFEKEHLGRLRALAPGKNSNPIFCVFSRKMIDKPGPTRYSVSRYP